MSGSPSKGSIRKSVEPNITLFSPAEIRVALLPVGEPSDADFRKFASLITRHRQVKLNNVRTFHHAAHKSPFKHIPWKTGHMNFKFLGEEAALAPSPLSALHSHRQVLGVIGILHCPSTPDLAKACRQFEQSCKAFNAAFTVRLLGFEPTDAQVADDLKSLPSLETFPSGSEVEHLEHQAEVIMHDFAACILGELERWMLNASPAMLEFGSLVDAAEFTGAGPLESVQTRLYTDEEVKTKRRYGRLQKALGDHSLLAGSPEDAMEHFTVAADLCRVVGDWIFQAGALEGQASAKALAAVSSGDGFAEAADSVFDDDNQWRRGRGDVSQPTTPLASSTTSIRDAEMSSTLDDHDRTEVARASQAPSDPGEISGLLGSGHDELSRAVALARATSSGHIGTAFGGTKFWAALRASNVESEIRELLSEAKAALRRKGAVPLQVETDLKLARFLAGLHGDSARLEVSDVVSGMLAMVEGMTLPEDRMLTFVEGAGVLGSVGSTRKRMLLLWQAVELSKMLGFPNLRSLEVACKVLEPPLKHTDPVGVEDPWITGSTAHKGMHAGGAGLLWPQVRAGCLEAILGLAIYAQQHTAVWDSAALLLRDHPAELSSHRQRSLLENMVAASVQMDPTERARPGPGPPPLLHFIGVQPPPEELRVIQRRQGNAESPSSRKNGASDDGNAPGLFLYDPFQAKRKSSSPQKDPGSVSWVVGETGAVEIEVSNPSSVPMRIEKLVLEVEYEPLAKIEPGKAFRSIKSTWKSKPVSLNVPPETLPVRIALEGTPLQPGRFTFVGCRLTAFGGVTWVQHWEPAGTSVADKFDERNTGQENDKGMTNGRNPSPSSSLSCRPVVTVLPPLPILDLEVMDLAGVDSSREDRLATKEAPPVVLLSSLRRPSSAPITLRPLAGQRVTSLALRIANRGKAAAEAIRLTVDGGAREKKEGTGDHQWWWDEQALQSRLPLVPGAEIMVNLRLNARGTAAGVSSQPLTISAVYSHCIPDDRSLEEGTDVEEGRAAPASSSAPDHAQVSSSSSTAGGNFVGGSSSGRALLLERRARLPLSVQTQPSVTIHTGSLRFAMVPSDDSCSCSGSPLDISEESPILTSRLIASLRVGNTSVVPLKVCLVCQGRSQRQPQEQSRGQQEDSPTESRHHVCLHPGESTEIQRILSLEEEAWLRAELARQQQTLNQHETALKKEDETLRQQRGHSHWAAQDSLARLLEEILSVQFTAYLETDEERDGSKTPRLGSREKRVAVLAGSAPESANPAGIQGVLQLPFTELRPAISSGLRARLSPGSLLGLVRFEGPTVAVPESVAMKYLPATEKQFIAGGSQPGKLVKLQLEVLSNNSVSDVPTVVEGSFICSSGGDGRFDGALVDAPGVFWSGQAKGVRWTSGTQDDGNHPLTVGLRLAGTGLYRVSFALSALANPADQAAMYIEPCYIYLA